MLTGVLLLLLTLLLLEFFTKLGYVLQQSSVAGTISWPIENMLAVFFCDNFEFQTLIWS